MRSLICALAAAGVARVVHASDGNIPPQTTTSGLSFAGDKRADPTASITLGASGDYALSLTSGAPKPSGTSFTIVPAGDKAEDGINLIFGPDLKSNIESARQTKCSDSKSPDCVNAILDLLPIDQVGLQRRQVGLLVSIGVGLRYVLTGIILAFAAKNIADGYHAPMSNAVQAETPTAASAYAVVTSTGASPIVMTVQPSDTPDPTPSIGAGDGKGFTINAATQDLAQRTDDLAGQTSGGCPAPKTKRAPAALRLSKRDPPDPETIACLLALTVTLVQNMVQGPLAQWIRVNLNNRNIAPAGAGAAVVLANADNQLAEVQQQLGLNQQQLQAVRNVAYWQAFNRLIRLQHDGQVVRVSEDDINFQYCPPKKNLDCANQSCKGTNGKCADDSLLKGCECGDDDDDDNGGSCDAKVETACSNCGGDDGSGKCKGVGDKLKGCGCWGSPQRSPGFFKSPDDLKAVQQALLGLKDLPDPPPNPTDGEGVTAPHCELRKRDGDFALVTMDTDFFKSLVNAACKDFPGDPDKSFDKKLTNKDADPKYKNSFNDYTVEFKWDDKPGSCAPLNCVQVWTGFVNGATTQCAPDSHSMAQSGVNDLDCGTATYTITAPVSQCPAVYPVNADKPTYHTWWDNNHCDKKCPNAKFTCTDGWNDAVALCSCDDQSCQKANQANCANPKKSNPW